MTHVFCRGDQIHHEVLKNIGIQLCVGRLRASIKDGGALCDICANHNSEGLKILDWFNKLYSVREYDENNFGFIDYKELLNNVYSYYLFHVNLKLKDYKF